MSDLYADDDVSAGLTALLGFDPHESTRDAWAASARRLLDAVAPAIAARALREAARRMTDGTGEPYDPNTDYDQRLRDVKARRRWLFARADEIERA